MGTFLRRQARVGAAVMVMVVPGLAACAATAPTGPEDPDENTDGNDHIEELSEEPQEVTAQRTAEANERVEGELVADIASRYAYPVRDLDADNNGSAVFAAEDQWHAELVEYWGQFPYDEVAAAYGCEISDVEISESGQGVPTRSYVINCDELEVTDTVGATIHHIETKSAELPRG